MTIDLHNKKFKTEFNSENGEVNTQTIFSYYQEENIVWDTYFGGQIIKGSLVGKIVDNHLEFVYQHINTDGEIMTGKCTSYPETTKENKLRLKEFWQWTCKDNSKGESVLIEI